MIANEENGPFIEYYPDGKIAAEGAYLHGPNNPVHLNSITNGELYKTMQCYSGRCYRPGLKVNLFLLIIIRLVFICICSTRGWKDIWICQLPTSASPLHSEEAR
jgi:hypothetical protein